MTPEFFQKHLDMLDWERVSGNTAMAPEFFEKHLDKLYWDRVSDNPAMIEKYNDIKG